MRWKSWLCELQWLFRMLLPWGIQWGRLFLCRSIICNFCNNFQISQRSHKSQLKFIHDVTNFLADLSRHWRFFFSCFRFMEESTFDFWLKNVSVSRVFSGRWHCSIWKTLAICAGLTVTKTRRWSKFLNWRKLNFINWRSINCGLFFVLTDIDECQTSNPCDKNADCLNTNGSYTCACKPGFTGNGSSCVGRWLFQSGS